MRCNTLQILWHNKQPVFSVDFNKSGELATAGADKEIRLWRVFDNLEDKSKSDVEYLCNLTSHSKTVNVVRFSPDGNSIVSAGDSGEVVMWRKVPAPDKKHKGKGENKESNSNVNAFRESAGVSANASWKAVGSLRGQTDDVQDLAWSPDGSAVVTGSIENVAFLWDAEKHRSLARLDGHHHYIQGVAWDPLGEYIITQSGDRSCRIYAPKAVRSKVLAKGGSAGSTSIASRIRASGVTLQRVVTKPMLSEEQERSSPSSADTAAEQEQQQQQQPTSSHAAGEGNHSHQHKAKKQKVDRQTPHFLFHDENMPSFFRRLSWSPDGSFLACPAGLYKREADNKLGNCVHIFKRGQWSKPLITLPALSKAVVAVKFCPVLFEHRKNQGDGQGAEEKKETNNQETKKIQPVQIAIERDAEEEEEEAEKRKRGDAKHVFDLPYLIYFAVVTLDSVILYETSSPKPVALMSGLHCASITDLAWSPDGRRMAVSSHDGYCSFISFDEGELGCELSDQQRQSLVEAQQQKHAKELQGEPTQQQQQQQNTPASTKTAAEVQATLAGEKKKEQQVVAPPQADVSITTVNGEGATRKRIAPTRIAPVKIN